MPDSDKVSSVDAEAAVVPDCPRPSVSDPPAPLAAAQMLAGLGTGGVYRDEDGDGDGVVTASDLVANLEALRAVLARAGVPWVRLLRDHPQHGLALRIEMPEPRPAAHVVTVVEPRSMRFGWMLHMDGEGCLFAYGDQGVGRAGRVLRGLIGAPSDEEIGADLAALRSALPDPVTGEVTVVDGHAALVTSVPGSRQTVPVVSQWLAGLQCYRRLPLVEEDPLSINGDAVRAARVVTAMLGVAPPGPPWAVPDPP